MRKTFRRITSPTPFPSSRCASAIQIVRPLESMSEAQPPTEICCAALLTIQSRVWCSFAQFNLGPHSVDLRRLLQM